MKNKKKSKKILIPILLVFLFAIGFIGSYLYGLYRQIVVTDGSTDYEVIKTVIPEATPDPYAPKNILLLGYGGAGHDGGYLTDTIILAKVYPKEKKIILISIPRDLWVEMPISETESKFMKINNAYSLGKDVRYTSVPDKYKGEKGAGRLAKEAVSKVVGENVDYFISVDFSGFKSIVDILGGVSVNVPYTFDDNYYPIKGKEDDTCGKSEEEVAALTATMSGELLEKQFTCRYEQLHFDKGPQVLESESALKFVRSRHSSVNGTDFGRAQRQQAFLVGIKEKMVSLDSARYIIPLLSEMAKNLKTDINLTEAYKLLTSYHSFGNLQIYSISLNDDNVLKSAVSGDKQYILISKDGIGNYDLIKNYIKFETEKYLNPEDINTTKSSPAPTP